MKSNCKCNCNSKDIDTIVKELMLSSDIDTKQKKFEKIREMAQEAGVFLASINDFYLARGRGEISGFTVPAVNLRGLTYDLARAIIRSAIKNKVGAFIFEIAKSEIAYTDQRPYEYAGVCLAAALKEGFKGPVFVQGDHFQVNIKKYKENPTKEMDNLKAIIKEAIASGFYNIDIDSSTLVDLNKLTILEQQQDNYKVCAELTKFIREVSPKGITVSVGGEIGEVGHKNSTPEELRGFMEGYRKEYSGGVGISKISVQTGTTHGGVVLPNGKIAEVKIDFETLRVLAQNARDEFRMGGAVQHGASTLPAEAFHTFAEVETAEVHLATEFQNMIYNNPSFPNNLKEKIYVWIKENLISEKKEKDTEEQFIYKSRKKAFGPFKKDLMELPQEVKANISKEIENKFDFLFKELKVINTRDLVDKYIKEVNVSSQGFTGNVAENDGEGDD
ncbi:MAG: class II fructose-bisphosphate aldolase [bacterium]